MILAILAGLVVGLFNGVRRRRSLGVQPIVATLSLLVAGRGLALVLTSGGLVQLFIPGLNKLSAGQTCGGWPYVMSSRSLLVVVVAILVRRTTFGYRLVAIGGNRRASILAGLPVRRTIITVYALSGVLAAVAGIIATARIHAGRPVLPRARLTSSTPSPRSWSAARRSAAARSRSSAPSPAPC